LLIEALRPMAAILVAGSIPAALISISLVRRAFLFSMRATNGSHSS
jgi:hypothetical protein